MTSQTAPQSGASNVLGRLRPASRIVLHRLTTRQDDSQSIVGRLATGKFVALPHIGHRAIELFQQNRTLGEAQAQLKRDFGADVDLDTFVRTLADLGFVRTVDGTPVSVARSPKPSLPWLRRQHVRWLSSLPAQLAYGALLLFTLFSILANTSLIPRYNDFLWTTVTSLAILGNVVMDLFRVGLHELGHLFAARSLGIPARFGLSTRLHNLVIQTDVSGLWAVPRRHRYQVYLGGIIVDLALTAVATLVLAYAAIPPTVQAMLKTFVLLTFLSVVSQFHFYMRTDIYFVVLDLLHCYNLFQDSLTHARHVFRRLWFRIARPAGQAPPPDPLNHLASHERRKVSLYAWFVITGSALALFVYIGYGIPILVGLLAKAGVATWQGLTEGQLWTFLDGAITLAILGSLQGLLVYQLGRKRIPWLRSLWAKLKRRLPSQVAAAPRPEPMTVAVTPYPALAPGTVSQVQPLVVPVETVTCEACGSEIPNRTATDNAIDLAICPFCLAKLPSFEPAPAWFSLDGVGPDGTARQYIDLMARTPDAEEATSTLPSLLEEVPDEIPAAASHAPSWQEADGNSKVVWMALELGGDATRPTKRMRCLQCGAELPAQMYECACQRIEPPTPSKKSSSVSRSSN